MLDPKCQIVEFESLGTRVKNTRPGGAGGGEQQSEGLGNAAEKGPQQHGGANLLTSQTSSQEVGESSDESADASAESGRGWAVSGERAHVRMRLVGGYLRCASRS